ncbi:MAG: site-2 protease family protein [Promethearchaeota archaeon]
MSLLDIILNFVLNPWFILSVIFWIFVLLLVRLLRNRKEAYYLWFPLLAMFKTKKLNNFLTKIGRKAPKFWKIFWTIGIFISFGFTIYALYFFFTNFLNLIISPSIEQAVIPLIPGVNINLPMLFYLILPLLFILTTHEFAHGISATADEVDIKSTGVLGAGLFFVIGFGAFVEVDERELKSKKFHRNTRLRIAAAGTFVNGMTAGVALILLLSFPLMIAPFYHQTSQVSYVLTEGEGGFNYGNLESGDVIIEIIKETAGDDEHVVLDNYAGRSLTNVLNNQTSLQCSIGDNLTFRVYNPYSDSYSLKNITLGPRYNIGIGYKYISNTEIQITKIYSASEGGNNYYTNLTVGDNIIEVNGVLINQTSEDTLENALREFNLNTINLTTDTYIPHTLNVSAIGVKIGIHSISYFMHKNAVAKFFTSYWPEFWLREIAWLFIIAFSVTLFNVLPLPVFDGDRMVKEVLDWGFGQDYKTTRKKKEKVKYKKDEKEIYLSEIRVKNVDYVKFLIENKADVREQSEIVLAEDKYRLIDHIGDGFKDTITLDLPEPINVEEDTLIEISYEYLYDEKQRVKKPILNILRYFTLFIVFGNVILSFIKFGGVLFWI